MKPLPWILFLGFTFAISHPSFSFQKEVKETIEKTLTFSDPAGEKDVIVDNINGSIDVMGYDGQEVQLLVHKVIFARSDEKIQKAREEIRLDIRQDANTIEFYVDAPYRCRDGSINYRGWRHYGYEVTYDFEVKIPRRCNVVLKTINEGDIKVKNIDGNFEIHNINDGIEAREISGAGRIYALNGDVIVTFTKNPEGDSYFGSLNGLVEVTFLEGLSADLRFKTFNGEVYTDFPVTYLPPRQPARKRKDGKFIYKSDRAFGARVGKGGPELEFDGFNGDIYVIKKER